MAEKTPNRKVLAAAVPVQLVIGLLTLRDIRSRTKAEIRGPILLWKVWGTTNTFGSLAYWKFGRRLRVQPPEQD